MVNQVKDHSKLVNEIIYNRSSIKKKKKKKDNNLQKSGVYLWYIRDELLI
jgi:hypothetical protein